MFTMWVNMDNQLLLLLIIAFILGMTLILIVLVVRLNKHQRAQIDATLKNNQNDILIKIIKENAELKETLNHVSTHQSHQVLLEFRSFEQKLSDTLNTQIEHLRNRIDIKLSEGFDKTRETFQNVMERLTRIDEAQKQIEKISSEVGSLQDILSDKKARGVFGEVQLSHILSIIFGEHNLRVYELQKKLSNGTTVDAVLYTPKPMGMLSIDSKFPLENYKRMLDQSSTDLERKEAQKRFKADVKKHIDDIEARYIITNETSDQAVMFVPAEAVFAHINAYHFDLIEHAQRKRVWLASPTTLMASLTSIQVLLRNIERDRYSEIIQEELKKLSDEFTRYQLRWTKLKEHMDKMNKHVSDVHTTSEKISKRFESISRVEFQTPDEIELPEED